MSRPQIRETLLSKLSVEEGIRFNAKCNNLAANWFRPFTKEENERYIANSAVVREATATIYNLKNLLKFLDYLDEDPYTNEESI